MFNLGAPEVLVIAILALIVLGPTRLPEAAKQVGRAMSEVRKMSTGFQKEMKAAFDEESASQARSKVTPPAGPVSQPLGEPVVDAPAVMPPAPTKKAAPRKRAAPLKAPSKPTGATKATPAKKAAPRKPR